MAAAAKKPKETELQIPSLAVGSVTVCVLGVSPYIANAMSFKTKQELLFPKGRKTAADKVSNLKHNPIEEYRNSSYLNRDDNGPTRLHLLGVMFKKAMQTAALRLPGVQKSEIGQLVYVEENRIDLYGMPQLYMAVTRSKDINKTPDVRTRLIVPNWAARVTICFITPNLKDVAIGNLIAAGGQISGVGDYRVEKGSGSFGRFKLVSPDNQEFLDVCKIGREAQDAALESPTCYDDETDELFSWFNVEVKRRGFKVA